MKKSFIPAVLAAAVLSSALLFGGCDVSDTGRYEKYRDDGYRSGGASLTDVTQIEVDWLSGDVSVEISSAATEISFSETAESGEASGSLALRYSLVAGDLEIRFAASGAKTEGVKKDLAITLPASAALLDLEIDVVSGNVTVGEVTALELAVETVSGKIASSAVFSEGSFDTVNGDVELVLSDGGFRCEFASASGKLIDEFGAELVRGEYVYGVGGIAIEVETVSGNLSLKKRA